MTSAEKLESADRCLRAPFLSRKWERRILHPTAALYRAIETGLTYSGEDDCGQVAADALMTLAVDRGLDSPQADLFGLANHLAALADYITWLLRPSGFPWERPADVRVGEESWESSVFLNEAGTRLKRFSLVDHWSDERELAEGHSWYSAGETSAYGMPMDVTVLLIGQNRAGRRHGPFSKAWTHPVSKSLRMRKRDGKGFDGAWKPVFREDTEFSREKWLDAMTADGVLEDAVFQVEVPVHMEAEKIRRLAEKKLASVRGLVVLPDPSPSQCDSPLSPCQFRGACWGFQSPSVQLGFVRIPTDKALD
jgi:hypothetical protein